MGDWPVLVDGQRFESSTTSLSAGTAVTTTGLNAKGSWTTVATPSFAGTGFNLVVVCAQAGREILMDLGIGATPDIILNDFYLSPGSVGGIGRSVYLPIPLVAGQPLKARFQTTATGTIPTVSATVIDGGYTGAPPLGLTSTYGADTTSTGGTAIDAGAVANTKGLWVEMTPATARQHRSLMMVVGTGGNLGMSTGSFSFDIGIGTSGSERVLIADLCGETSAGDDLYAPNHYGPWPCHIPAGSRLVVRSSSTITDATDRVMDVVLYGMS